VFKGDRQLTPLVGNLMQSEFEIISGFFTPYSRTVAVMVFIFVLTSSESRQRVIFIFV